MADALASGASEGNLVGVQVPPRPLDSSCVWRPCGPTSRHPCVVRRIVSLVVVLAALAGCGDRGASVGVGGDDESRVPSRGFELSDPPSRFVPAVAGSGTRRQDWGEDSTGTDEPYTVLVRGDDAPTADNIVVVSVTGFDGYEGGLSQASRGYCCGADANAEETEVDGHRAYFTPAHDDVPSDLVVAVDDDLAVRVSAPHASRDDAIALYKRASPRGHVRAPEVQPPGGYRIIGRVDADLVLAQVAVVQPRTNEVPGTSAAHTLGWSDGDASLAVLTVPASSGDLAALVAGPRFWGGGTTEVSASEKAVEIRFRGGAGNYNRNAVVVTSSWGDLIVAVSDGYQTEPASLEELQSLVRSAKPVDDAAWDAEVLSMRGGPGLHADRGAAELARGIAGGVEWLFQAVPGTPVQRMSPSDTTVANEWAADSCLKLDTGSRVCTQAGWGDEKTNVELSSAEPGLPDAPGLPPFIILNTPREAATVRLTDHGTETTTPLVRVPGDLPRWAAVIFTTNPRASDFPVCATDSEYRLELLDAHGEVVDCVAN